MNFLQDLKIPTKIAIAFGALVAITLISSAVTWHSVSNIRDADEKLAGVTRTSQGVSRLSAIFTAQREAVLGYMLTGDRHQVKEFENAAAEAAKVLETLKGSADMEPETAKAVTGMIDAAEEWRTRFVDRQVDLMRNALTVNTARAIEASGEPKAVVDAFHDHADAAMTRLAVMVDELGDAKAGAMSVVGVSVIAQLGVLVAFSVLFGTALTRLIARPISTMTGVMEALAEGNLDVEVTGDGRGDEIGAMAHTVQVFKDNCIRVTRLEAEQVENAKRAEAEKKAAMDQLADTFESSVMGIVQAVTATASQVQTSSQTLSAAATQTSQQSSTVAAAAEQASANVQTVATAAEELSASIAEISQQVARSSEVSNGAVAEAEKTNAQVQGLAHAAQRIGEVVSLISDIAEQTNLLALNATIEAARAGEAGKGFAVVANEVKSLANQTAKATDEISQQIGSIQAETQEAVTAIGGISGTIGEINEIAAAVAAAVEEQGAATGEIARNVSQAAAGTQEVTSNIEGVNQAATKTGDSADELLDSSSELTRQGESLSQEVGKFLSQVRSA
jgi:methyl-accepting chemotaxis protein